MTEAQIAALKAYKAKWSRAIPPHGSLSELSPTDKMEMDADRRAIERLMLGSGSYETDRTAVRERQADLMVQRWSQPNTLDYPIKVVPGAEGDVAPVAFGGYIVNARDVPGRSLDEVERMLGLPAGRLQNGAYLLQPSEVPAASVLVARGYTSKPRGEPFLDGSTFPPGELATVEQFEVREDVGLRTSSAMFVPPQSVIVLNPEDRRSELAIEPLVAASESPGHSEPCLS